MCLNGREGLFLIVEIDGVRKIYQTPEGEIGALEDITFSIEEGEFISIVGPSGCGKTTLLNIIAGLETPSGGMVRVDGTAIHGPNARIGYMPQKDQLFPWRTIWDNVTLGLEIQGKKDAEHRARVQELLMRYGLRQFAGCVPSQLSGGMRQRCALIRTLATSPRILLLDEPFSALDYQTRLSVAEDIHGIIKKEGKTAVLVTHDIAEAVSMSDRVAVLSARPGRLKRLIDQPEMRGLTPMERRDHPQFQRYFNLLWKEIDRCA